MSEVNGSPKQRRRWLAVALVGVLGLAACATNSAGDANSSLAKVRNAEPGKPISTERIPLLKVGLPAQVPSLDPKRIGMGWVIMGLGLESLMRIDSAGRLRPWLAAEFEQESDTTYVYTLRKGVKFWDGTELTSEDVKFSWDYLRDPKSPRAPYYASVKSIDTPDKYTVRVTLKKPDAAWKYTPAMFYSVIIQKKFTEKQGEKSGRPGTLVMGTGPWRFDSLNPTSGVELSAHADYWGGKPPIDRISAKSYSSDNSLALALRAGEIDIAPVVDGPKGFDAAAGGGTVTTVPTCATALLSMPTQTAPWDDVHVRRAVAYALDRKEIVAATQGRAGGPLNTLISPILLETLAPKNEVDEALKSVPTYPHDLQKAKAELAKSKVPDGFSFEIRIDGSAASVVEVIAAQLKKIGINLTIKTVQTAAWGGEITGPPAKRPLTFSETGTCTPDPSWDAIFLGSDHLAKGALNIANYAPKDIDELLADGLTTQEPRKRLEIYTKILQRLGEDVPYVPLYAEGATYASTKYDVVDHGSFWMNSPWALNLVPK